jgi:SAM-dependent methyltransferase
MLDPQKAIHLGHPSYVWGFGQERRLELVRRYAPLEGRAILDAGCGIGTYVQAFRRYSDRVVGVDVDPARIAEGRRTLPSLCVASAEALPFPSGSFDMVFSHEVLEHVPNDRHAVAEAVRVLRRPGGHLAVLVPNRGYPFETHGIYWRGQYRFGNIPLVNYLPARVRNRLCPHVRAYTARGLRRLLEGLPVRIVVHTQIFAGYDKLVRRRPRLGRLLRVTTYWLERTPARWLGLSHLLIAETT